MIDSEQNKTKKRKKKWEYMIFGLVMLVLIVVSLPLVKNFRKKTSVDSEIAKLEKEIIEVDSKNQGLKKLIAYLESDRFVEEEARLKLGYKKPGEEVVVIKRPEDRGLVIVDGVSDLEKDMTNPQRWWKYFFN